MRAEQSCEHEEGRASTGEHSMNARSDLQAARRSKPKAGPSRFKGGKSRGPDDKHWTGQDVLLETCPTDSPGLCDSAPDFIAQPGPLPRNTLADQ